MQKQVRTIKCGCGECQLRKNVADRCPQELNKDAIWLWCSDFSESKNEEPTVEELLEQAAEEIENQEA